MPAAAGDLTEPAQWQPIVSGRAELTLHAVAAGRAAALRLDFDFKGGGGFVVARRASQRSMPGEYAVTFRLRGRGGVNNLELKLVDAAGQNVWRHVIEHLVLSSRWHRMRIESRDIDFAWGPASGSGIAQLGALEFAVVAGEGGRGSIWIADVRIEDCTARAAPVLSASSARAGHEAPQGWDGSGWRPRGDDARPWLVIDSLEPRTLGGLVIEWLDEAPANGFRIRASNTGRRWKTVHAAARAGGKRSYVYLPGLKTRFIRLDLQAPVGAMVRLQPFDFSRTIDAFWHRVAAAESRAWLPRWLHREQTLWTPIGTADGVGCALMNGDGMVEVGQGSWSIEPMLLIGGRLFTWADVVPRQELREGWMPDPAVIWQAQDWLLAIEAEATVSQHVRIRYRIENRTDRTLTGRLFLLVRPFQVTPPWQSFRHLGGVSRIVEIASRDGAVVVDGRDSAAQAMRIEPMSEPAGFGALAFDEGFIAPHLAAGTLPPRSAARDEFGFATGALDFDLSIQAGRSCERGVVCMPRAAVRAAGEPAFDWGARLAVGQWKGNGWITDVIRAALTATAQVLVTRSGPALQPGPRRYTRSWIRDGAMMSAALLRMGHASEVREFIAWYAPHQRADGFVPCCVDREGIDWLVEHDSHGQLIALIADHHRFAPDLEFLAGCWTFVDKAVQCIAGLLGADGLLPVSVSHEGYLAQPVHSYWDDFWALRGLKDAVALARALGRADAVQRWTAIEERLAASLFASIEATRAERKLDFIPGSVEWADFDPTATANALYLLGIPDGLDRRAVERTFDKYLTDWRGKRSGAVPSTNYTPYEIRIIGALVRLGRRDAALELLRFFLSDRRPPAWNQWPEIAWRDQTAPAHVGDLPHTWIAAEYVLAVRSLFAYEQESAHALILAAGLAPEWIEDGGVHVNDMPTAYGTLRYTLRRLDAHALRFEIGSRIGAKIVLRPPLAAPMRSVTVNGRASSSFDGDSVTIHDTPAEIICVTL